MGCRVVKGWVEWRFDVWVSCPFSAFWDVSVFVWSRMRIWVVGSSSQDLFAFLWI